MALNSCQAGETWENRTVPEAGITAVPTTTASAIHFNYMTWVQQSTETLLSLDFNHLKEWISLRFDLDSLSSLWLSQKLSCDRGGKWYWGLRLERRKSSLSQVPARNVEAQHSTCFLLEQGVPWIYLLIWVRGNISCWFTYSVLGKADFSFYDQD